MPPRATTMMTPDATWDFRTTAFAQLWATLTQWRYVRILAFAWIVLGYARGFQVAAEPFRGLITATTAILACASFLDVIAIAIIGRRNL